jgi:hypothetical protein
VFIRVIRARIHVDPPAYDIMESVRTYCACGFRRLPLRLRARLHQRYNPNVMPGASLRVTVFVIDFSRPDVSPEMDRREVNLRLISMTRLTDARTTHMWRMS